MCLLKSRVTTWTPISVTWGTQACNAHLFPQMSTGSHLRVRTERLANSLTMVSIHSQLTRTSVSRTTPTGCANRMLTSSRAALMSQLANPATCSSMRASRCTRTTLERRTVTLWTARSLFSSHVCKHPLTNSKSTLKLLLPSPLASLSASSSP